MSANQSGNSLLKDQVSEIFEYYCNQGWQKHKCAWMLREEPVRREFLENGATYSGKDSLQYRCVPAGPLTEQRKSAAAQHSEIFLGLEVQVCKFYQEGVSDVVEERITLSKWLGVSADDVLRDAPLYRAYLLSQEIEGGAVDLTPDAAKALYSPSMLGRNPDPAVVKVVLKHAAELPYVINRKPTERDVKKAAQKLGYGRQPTQARSAKQAAGNPSSSEGLRPGGAKPGSADPAAAGGEGGGAAGGAGSSATAAANAAAAVAAARPANGGTRGQSGPQPTEPQLGSRRTRDQLQAAQEQEQQQQQDEDPAPPQQRPRTEQLMVAIAAAAAAFGGAGAGGVVTGPAVEAQVDQRSGNQGHGTASAGSSHHSTARDVQQPAQPLHQPLQQRLAARRGQHATGPAAAAAQNQPPQRDARSTERQQPKKAAGGAAAVGAGGAAAAAAGATAKKTGNRTAVKQKGLGSPRKQPVTNRASISGTAAAAAAAGATGVAALPLTATATPTAPAAGATPTTPAARATAPAAGATPPPTTPAAGATPPAAGATTPAAGATPPPTTSAAGATPPAAGATTPAAGATPPPTVPAAGATAPAAGATEPAAGATEPAAGATAAAAAGGQQQQLAAEREQMIICQLRDIMRIKVDSVQRLGPTLPRVISQWLSGDADCYVVLSSADMTPELRHQLANERAILLPLDSLPIPAALPPLPEDQGLHYMADQLTPVQPLPAKWPANEAFKADQLLHLMVGSVVLGERETVLLDLHRRQQLPSHAVSLDTGLMIELPIKQVFGWLDQQAQPWVQTQAD